MKNGNKELLFSNISRLNLSPNSKKIWRTIESGVAIYAKKLYDNRMSNNIAGSTYFDWWESCCDLLLHRQLIISDVNFDDNSPKGEEYIEILNQGPIIIDVSKLRINAGNKGQDFIFPERTIMLPKDKLRVYTQRKDGLSFQSNQPLLNNKGDTAYLYDQEDILISSWAYGCDVSDDIEIGFINYDGKQAKTECDEFIEIANTGPNWLDLSGWQVSAGKNQIFDFPIGSKIQPFCSIRVYTDLIDKSTGGYSFNSSRAIWNNKGDTGKLIDTKGTMVSEYTYLNA